MDLGKWDSILDSYHTPALLADSNEIVYLANRPAESLWNSLSDNLRHKQLEQLISETRDDLEWSIKNQLLRKNGFYHGTVLVKLENKSERLCQITMDRMNSNGDIFLISQFVIDKSASIWDYKDFVGIKNSINENVGTVKDIRHMGSEMHLDYRRILYLFKKFEGQTPKQFLKQLRITKCIDLLKSDESSLKEIAYELGFCDLSHLCNTFREEIGMTLKEYREQC